jgi:hypothetical protein
MRVSGEDPDDEASNQVNKSTGKNDDYDDDEYNNEGEVEVNTDEVVCKLVPPRVSLAKRIRESIYLTLCLHNLILTST